MTAADARRAELERSAPLRPRGLWKRCGQKVFLCGTLGPEFDLWQRQLAALSAADAYFAQQIGLEAVEREMDRLEAEARASLGPGETLAKRRSPGYGPSPLARSREIIDVLDATKALGVSLTESDLLVPSKSVTATCDVRGKDGCGRPKTPETMSIRKRILSRCSSPVATPTAHSSRVDSITPTFGTSVSKTVLPDDKMV